jgi:hypothetical protein
VTKGKPWTYQSIWGDSVPDEFVNESQPVVLGLRIQFHAAGRIVGARYYRHQDSHGGNIAFLKQSPSADQIDAATIFHHRNFGDGPVEGEWQNAYFPRPYIRVNEDDTWLLCVAFRQGLYWASRFTLDGVSVVSDDLEAVADDGVDHNGLYTYETDWNPYQSYQSSMYGIDVLFLDDGQL